MRVLQLWGRQPPRQANGKPNLFNIEVKLLHPDFVVVSGTCADLGSVRLLVRKKSPIHDHHGARLPGYAAAAPG